jgi:hypothetical protein
MKQGLIKQVVPRSSAIVPGQADAEPIVIHEDHINMAKYPSKGHAGYKTMSGHLQIMADAAVDKIRKRWDEEKRVQEGRRS